MYLYCSNKDTFTNIYKCIYLPLAHCAVSTSTQLVCVGGGEWPQNFTFNFLLPPSKAQKCSFKTCTLRHLPCLSLLLFSQVPAQSLRSVLSRRQTDWLSQEIYPWNDIQILPENHIVSLLNPAWLSLIQWSAFLKALPVSLLVPTRLMPRPNATQPPSLSFSDPGSSTVRSVRLIPNLTCFSFLKAILESKFLKPLFNLITFLP